MDNVHNFIVFEKKFANFTCIYLKPQDVKASNLYIVMSESDNNRH